MSTPPTSDDRFVNRVMDEVARHERRLPLVVGALAISALVLAVPAVVVLLARPALDAALSLALAGLAEAASAVADNPIFWACVAVTAAWLAWLASRTLRGGA